MLSRKELIKVIEKKECDAQAEEYRNDVIAATMSTGKLDVRDAQNQGWYQMGMRHALSTLKIEIIMGDYRG